MEANGRGGGHGEPAQLGEVGGVEDNEGGAGLSCARAWQRGQRNIAIFVSIWRSPINILTYQTMYKDDNQVAQMSKSKK